VSALASALGDRLRSLALDGAILAGSVFPAVVKHLPGLQSLTLVNMPDTREHLMAARITAFASRLTKPLKLALPPDLLE
jgi:hypothetical protein